MSGPSNNKTGLEEEEEMTSLEALSIGNNKTTFEEEAGFSEEEDVSFEEEELVWDIELIPPKSHTGHDLHALMYSTEPQDIGEDYVLQLFSPATITDMCAGLRTAGLGCELNTPANMVKYTWEVVNELPRGDMFVLSEGEKKYSADYTFKHDKDSLFSKFKELFANAYADKLEQHIGVHTTNAEDHFSSHSVDALKDILIDAGKIIGHLGGGSRINAGEVGLILADAIKALKPVKERMSSFEEDDVLTLDYSSQHGIEPFARGKIRQNIKFADFWCVFLTKIKVDPES